MAIKKKKIKKNPNVEFIYEFSNVDIIAKFDSEDIDNDDKIDIMKDILSVQSSPICLDKTYVFCDENNRSDSFIALEGWENLKELLITTNFGYNATQQQISIIEQAFRQLVIGFMYQILNMYHSEYVENIQLDFKDRSTLNIEIFEDTINDIKNY